MANLHLEKIKQFLFHDISTLLKIDKVFVIKESIGLLNFALICRNTEWLDVNLNIYYDLLKTLKLVEKK